MENEFEERNVKELKNILLHENPKLFLGAVFSYGSFNEYGKLQTGGRNLISRYSKSLLRREVDIDVENELKDYLLSDMCQFIYDSLKKQEELKIMELHKETIY